MRVKDELAKEVFGMTQAEARSAKCCLICHKPPIVTNEQEQREYDISAVCPECFVQLTAADDAGYMFRRPA